MLQLIQYNHFLILYFQLMECPTKKNQLTAIRHFWIVDCILTQFDNPFVPEVPERSVWPQGQLRCVQIDNGQKMETPSVAALIRGVYKGMINARCLHAQDTHSSRHTRTFHTDRSQRQRVLFSLCSQSLDHLELDFFFFFLTFHQI